MLSLGAPDREVVLALWQHLVAYSSGGLDCLDLHAGAGRYDLRRGDSQFHRRELDRAEGGYLDGCLLFELAPPVGWLILKGG